MPIVAMGRFPDEALRSYVLELTGKRRPRLLFVPTAGAETACSILAIHEQLGPVADVCAALAA